MQTRNHNCAIIIAEPSGLYAVKEYGWTKDSPYDQPGVKPFLRSRGSYSSLAQAQDDAEWVNHPELRRER
jgi:hypothetical protein